jgi:hypothetical protein
MAPTAPFRTHPGTSSIDYSSVPCCAVSMQSRGHSRPPWPHLVLRSNHLWGFTGRPVRRVSTQESENERVAALRESHRLWRCGARSFRRPAGGGSFRPLCPVWRSAENTILSHFNRSADDVGIPRRPRRLAADRHPCRCLASKSLSNNGHWPSTERRLAWPRHPSFGQSLAQAQGVFEASICRYFIMLSIFLRSADRSSARHDREFLDNCPSDGGV